MQHYDRKAKWVVAILCGFAVLFVAALLLVIFLPRTPKAKVLFSGYAFGPDGERQAVFAITNTGSGTLRRWDFYRAVVKGDSGKPKEIHIGPDSLLAPGQSEQVMIDVPSAELAWKVTFQFTDYNAIEAKAYENSGGDAALQPIASKLIDGGIDLKLTTEWIEPEVEVKP
jgi:hypothetical protein